MNLVKKLTAVAVAGVIANTASALTVVVNFEGTVDEINAPAALGIPTNDPFATSQQYNGQVVIRNYESMYAYNRDLRQYESTVGNSIDVSTNQNIGFTIGHPQLQQMEGARGFIPNPSFNPALPPCSQRDIDRARNGCDASSVLNPSYARLSQNAADFDELLGDATLNLRNDGFLETFNWSFGRQGKLNPDFDPSQEEGRGNRKYLNSISSYDNILKDLNVPFLMDEVNLQLSNFAIADSECNCLPEFFAQGDFDGQDNEILYLTADAFVSVDVIQEVPVPAAAWLFGSAMLGLAGLKRKK